MDWITLLKIVAQLGGFGAIMVAGYELAGKFGNPPMEREPTPHEDVILTVRAISTWTLALALGIGYLILFSWLFW
ncbi:hypothetical protein [Thioalkalivibrio sp. ARh3]|uniref:hypothetical protein n=1 Tax=Thioalkalivibrio sp. ARh3 TaxID=1158148 RepID=UPI00037F9355|nr:hypothetical protein [Thioalkalivibrio sp. ARh3]